MVLVSRELTMSERETHEIRSFTLVHFPPLLPTDIVSLSRLSLLLRGQPQTHFDSSPVPSFELFVL